MKESSRCICCGSYRIEENSGYFVPFISIRAFSINKKNTSFLHCKDCDFYWAKERFNSKQMELIYTNYRGEEYQKQRQIFEPEYTPEFNASLGGSIEERSRKDGIFSMVNKYFSPESMEYILDYGGDHGQFFPEQYKYAHRYVYDISEVELIDGVERLNSVDALGQYPWNLVLCCHVLEHLPYPREELKKIITYLPVGAYLYVEVPYEDYFYTFISQNEAVPIHEHVNFFNEKSLQLLFNDTSIAILELKKDGLTLRVLAMKISKDDILCKYLNMYRLGLEIDDKIKNITSDCMYTKEIIIDELKNIELKFKDYNNRYPKWIINILSCFILKRENRIHMRKKYSR